MKTRSNPFLRNSLILSAVLALGSAANAANLYWDVSSANNLTAGAGTWGTDSFWATSSAPLLVAPGAYTPGSDVFFQTAGTNAVAIDAGGVSANSLTQTTNSTATTIASGGGTLTITGTAGIVNSGNSALVINSAVTLGSGSPQTYTFNAGNTITMGGAIGESGAAIISKTGTGVLNLNASNSYSGGTTITAGRVSVGASGTLGSDVIGNNVSVSAGANLTLADAANIGGNQILTINSSSSALGGIGVGATFSTPAFTNSTSTFGGVYGINYTGTNGFTSMATLESTLNANSGGGTGRWYLGSQTTGTFNGATLAAASDNIYRLGGGGGTLTMSQTNVLTGANALQVGSSLTNGGGTVILGAAQNFTGSTTVSGGLLRLGNAGALGSTSGITLTNGTFDFAGFTPTANVALALNSATNTADIGSLENTTGTVTFGGAISLGTPTVVVGTTASGLTFTNTITGNSRGLRKDGTGNLILSNSGTVTLAALAANRGTIQVDSGTTLNVTTITVGSGNSVGSGLTLNGGNVTASGAALFGTATTGTASGTLQLNAGSTLTVPSLNKGGSAGASVVFNANFNGGTLKANASSATFFSGANAAKIQAGGLTIDDGGYLITASQILTEDSGSTGGSLTKSGIGTLTLSGANSYTGGTNVNAGTLLWSGANALPTTGTIAVGAVGRFSLADGAARSSTTPALTLANGAGLSFDWTGASTGDQLTSTASITPTAGSVFGISITPSGTPSGSVTLLTGGGSSTLSSSKFYLANNTNYTAALTTAATTVSIGSYASATALTSFYWTGNKLVGSTTAGVDNALALSDGTKTNWSSTTTAYTQTGLTPGSTANVIFANGQVGKTQQNTVLGADMSLLSLTIDDSVAVTIGGGNALTLLSTLTTAGTASGTPGSAITVTSTAANPTISANLVLGANQTWNVASGKTLSVSGNVAENAAGRTLTKASAGTLSLSGANTYSGATTVQGGGTLQLTGSGVINPTTGAGLNLGASTSAGTLQYDSSGTSKFGAINVGTGTTAPGTLNQTAGTINATSLTLNSGYSGTGAGTVNLSGGTMTISGATTISNTTAADLALSTFTISGASTTLNANGDLRLTGNDAVGRYADGQFVQTSGTVNVAGTNGLLLVQGRSTNTATRRGQYDLNGGTLNVNTITSTSTAAADAVATFNFNGGTLKPTASSTTFWVNNAQTTANVQQGGANIDTGVFDITIAQSLLHAGIGTNDVLTKSGSGTLTLSVANTYTGDTTVSAGKLVLGNNNAAGTVGAIKLTGATSVLESASAISATNNITLSNAGAKVNRVLAATEAFSTGTSGALKSSFAGGTPDTTAQLLDGTSSAGGIFSMSFSDISVASNDAIRRSDVFTTSGTGTDTYVIQLLTSGGLASDSVLGWLDNSNAWVNAGTATFFNTAYNNVLTVGNYGFDPGTNSVWAVVNHGGSFTAVPEPTSALAGLLIAAGLLRRRRVA